MTFDNMCKQLLSNQTTINALISNKIINFCYVEEDLASEIIKLQNLIILRFQNPKIKIDVGIGERSFSSLMSNPKA